ncbi:hypothetical protein OMP43_19525 [Sphingomonas sp. CBMAI 2297]|uniref:hypothetical protein n=1 Tax=Sphingomonas sp. CBMAI 2297 TaxID=2991720 RepID=UPI00245594BD|nr:hypothetical protein [Sphingomonas sp. CBMAI 2297]MDH4746223.1 hypothetical protein [Sphingomonas sp. CBMAI 2297]
MTDYEKERLLFEKYLEEFREKYPQPELTLTSRGNPDPRLVELVRLLARKAAREYLESEKKARSADSSKPM